MAFTQTLFEVIRFGMTGMLSLVSYLMLSNMLYYVGVEKWLATAIAWSIAALVSYFGHIYFSYRVSAEHQTMSYRFALMLVVHFLQTAGLTYLLSDVLMQTYLVTTVVTVCITPLTTFSMGKYWVFRKNEEEQ